MGQRARARVSADFRLDQMGARMERLLIDAIGMRSARHADAGSGSRPICLTSDDAASDAADVVEDLQAAYVPHWRWVASVIAGRPGAPAALNARAFRSLTILEPAYRWGLRRGWAWLPAVRRRLRGPVRRLLRLDR
jgi:hypothetical protein